MNDILEVAAEMELDHLHGKRGITNKIKEAMFDAAKTFVYIGFLLWEVKHYEYYYEGDYDDVYEYAEKELGFKPSSTKNFIAICKTFCKRNEKFGTPTMMLDDRWSDYQYSQLTEMLAMSPTQRLETKPTMTVRDLRSMKQKDREEAIRNTQPPASMLQQAPGQTSGQEIRWIKFQNKSPQTGKYPCKLVIHTVWMNNKPKQDIDFGFYRDGKWSNRQGKEILDVTHYSELPDFPK